MEQHSTTVPSVFCQTTNFFVHSDNKSCSIYLAVRTYLSIRTMLLLPEKEKIGKNGSISFQPFSRRQQQRFELRVHSAFEIFFSYLSIYLAVRIYLSIRTMLLLPEKEKIGKNGLISFQSFSRRQQQRFELRVHSAFKIFFIYLSLQIMLVCVSEKKNKNSRSSEVRISQFESTPFAED